MRLISYEYGKNDTRVKHFPKKGRLTNFPHGDLFHGLRDSFDDIPRHIIDVDWK